MIPVKSDTRNSEVPACADRPAELPASWTGERRLWRLRASDRTTRPGRLSGARSKSRRSATALRSASARLALATASAAARSRFFARRYLVPRRLLPQAPRFDLGHTLARKFGRGVGWYRSRHIDRSRSLEPTCFPRRRANGRRVHCVAPQCGSCASSRSHRTRTSARWSARTASMWKPAPLNDGSLPRAGRWP
jgi:hypothetical protein